MSELDVVMTSGSAVPMTFNGITLLTNVHRSVHYIKDGKELSTEEIRSMLLQALWMPATIEEIEARVWSGTSIVNIKKDILEIINRYRDSK